MSIKICKSLVVIMHCGSPLIDTFLCLAQLDGEDFNSLSFQSRSYFCAPHPFSLPLPPNCFIEHDTRFCRFSFLVVSSFQTEILKTNLYLGHQNMPWKKDSILFYFWLDSNGDVEHQSAYTWAPATGIDGAAASDVDGRRRWSRCRLWTGSGSRLWRRGGNPTSWTTVSSAENALVIFSCARHLHFSGEMTFLIMKVTKDPFSARIKSFSQKPSEVEPRQNQDETKTQWQRRNEAIQTWIQTTKNIQPSQHKLKRKVSKCEETDKTPKPRPTQAALKNTNRSLLRFRFVSCYEKNTQLREDFLWTDNCSACLVQSTN